MTVRRLRQSEIKSFKNCRREWLWSWVHGLDKAKEEAGATDIGTLVHKALEGWYARNEDPVEIVREERAIHTAEAGDGALPKSWVQAYELAEIMVEGYVEWVETEGVDAGYEIIGVEQPVEVSFGTFMGDEVIITGRQDLLMRHVPTGLVYVVDNKTVQSLDQAGRQLAVDDQLATYALLRFMADGTLIGGALHNMLRKVKRTANATPPFYGRVTVTFNETHLRNHHRHMLGVLSEMVRAYQAIESDHDLHHEVAYPNPTKDCTWRCPFIDICPMADDGSDVDGALRALYVPTTHGAPSAPS